MDRCVTWGSVSTVQARRAPFSGLDTKPLKERNMAFPSDLEIARNASLKPIEGLANEMGIGSHLLEPYGEHVMKIKLDAMAELATRPKAKYVVVTAITPTPLGEGKTTT